MDKQRKPGLFDDKRVVFVTALVLAVFSWVVVAGFINPGGELTISGVTIDYERTDDEYTRRDLVLVSDLGDFTAADVRVSGDGSVIGGLSSTDVTVYADFSVVTGPGTYMVPLRAEAMTGGNFYIDGFSVNNNDHSLDKSPLKSIQVTFEQLQSKTVPVSVSVEGITAAEGFFRDTPVPSHTEVTVSGPESEVSRVAQAQVKVEETAELNETTVYGPQPLTLTDSGGQKVNYDRLTLSPSELVEVTVPILEVREIGLAVGVIGMPQTLDMEWFNRHISLSQTSAEVVGASADLANLSDPYIVAEVDIGGMVRGWESEPILIEYPEGVRSNDNVRQVTARLDSSSFGERSFEVSNIRVVNGPPGYDIVPIRESISVTLVGDEAQLEALTAQNVAVVVDAFNVTGTGGQQTVAARIEVPAADRVYAVGTYSLVCDVLSEQDESA